jgi:hypothetical protein
MSEQKEKVKWYSKKDKEIPKTGRMCVWDFTLSVEQVSFKEMKKWLSTNSKKYAFQKEKGEKTGYLHWQGRISLKEKLILSEVLEFFPDGGYISITSNANKMNNFYVMKTKTRVEGPWTEKDLNKDIEGTSEFIPEIYRGMPKWKPWQKDAAEMVFEEKSKLVIDRNRRNIHFILGFYGNEGKTHFTSWFDCNGDGIALPPSFTREHLHAAVLARPINDCYFIDIPRAVNMKKQSTELCELFSGIEQIKNGIAYKERYEYKMIRFNHPQVWIFANTIPPMNLVSSDRWKLYIIKDNKLKRVSIESMQRFFNHESEKQKNHLKDDLSFEDDYEPSDEEVDVYSKEEESEKEET